MSVLDALTAEQRAAVREGPPPTGSDAMKAVLVGEPFDDPDWVFERKLDGIRCIAVRDGGPVRMLSRNDLSLNGRFPEVAAALDAQPCERFAVDGEIVAFAGSRTSFERLAQRGRRAVKVYLYAFDLLWVEGMDVRDLPLLDRKRLLRAAIDLGGALRWTPHRNGTGIELFEHARRLGWEGIVAKRAASPYRARRSRDWLKIKADRSQELVIGGWTPPKGSREELGALLLGVYDADGALRYAGKVGTGFDRATLRDLAARMAPLRRDTPPFADADAIRERGATWVEPQLVAQVGFTEWTRDGRLRHPRFLGLREDKPARDVVREVAIPA
ncbi:MAG TPA: non-homologous end-joining DNA ligase [Capillimicrobium sp.]|nr:non-homologous end-joining DNA ligase [Capillimicrobium sp.]